MNARAIITALTTAASGALAAPAGQGWSVCTTDLVITPISEPSVEGRTITARDENGTELRLPLRAVYMLRAPRAPAPLDQSSAADDTRLLELTDAQRLPVVVLTTDDPDTVLVRSLVHDDERAFPLEDIRAISRNPDTAPQPLTDDRITLVNGDTIEGFIVEIADRVAIETSTGITELELTQIDRIEIVNDAAPRPGVQALIGDGARVSADTVRVSTSGSVVLTLDRLDSDEPLTLLPDQFGGIDVVHADSALVPLASITPAVTVTGDNRIWTPDPTLADERLYASALRDIEIPAPAKLVYELPENTTRFATTAQLLAGQWSDCVLIIACESPQGAQELQRTRLRPGDDRRTLNTPIPTGATALVIEIDPGVNGPLQDRILLRAPRLKVSRSTQFE